MKKSICFALTVLLLTFGAKAQLSVGSSSLNIKSGTTFSTQGLVFTPSADLSIVSNSISFSGTAITNGTDQSINRVHSIASPLSSYSGLVGIQYSAGELNGNVESDLQIAYNPLSSGGSFFVTSGSSTGSSGSYFVSNTLSSKDLGVITALPNPTLAPTITTTSVTIFDATSATLGGEVTSDGGAAISERGVVYSSTNTTPEIGGADVTQDSNGNGTGTFSESVGLLTESTTYYFQAYAINTAGTSYGGVMSFTTLCSVPGVHLYRSNSLIDDYCTIQAAVDASQDGDSIQVDAGTYVEQVTITTGITLHGAGRDVTIIQSPDKSSLTISGGNWKNLKNQDIYDVVGIKATNDVPVVIKNLRVDGNSQGYFPLAPDINGYDFQGIGVFNTTVTIDNVYVTSIRGLASEQSFFPPEGYPVDQPLGYNHNDAIFAESSIGAGPHTLTVTNSYITKFQKTAILAWGPTLTVDINNNIIQGYGKTMWSTGNGIQIASANRTGYGGSNGDRRGTTGSVTNNNILDLGIIVPGPSDPGSYFNPGLGGSTGILLWEAGDGFIIEGNTITRTEYIPSWNSVTTSNNGGWSNMAIDAVSTTNVVVNNNTIFNFDEGLISETYIVTPNIIATGNTISHNTHDYFSGGGNDNYSLNDSAEVIAYNATGNGVDTLSGFSVGDKIYVNDISVTGCVNGLIGGIPTVDFTGGTVTEGDGTNVAAHSMQVHYDGTHTYLYIDTDGNLNQGELEILLTGEYITTNFLLDGPFIYYQISTPTTQATDVTFSNVLSDQMDVSWIRGNGDSCAVFMYQGITGTASPLNNVYYNADTAFQSGDQIGTSGWYCVYRGIGTFVTVTGLTDGTDYRLHVCEFNIGSIHYNTSASTGNPANQTTCGNPTDGGTIASDQDICSGATPAGLTSYAAPTGQSGTIEYKWQYSTDNFNTISSTIENSNSATYNPSSLTQTTWYKRLARVECMSDWTGAAESNVVEVTVAPATVAGAISGSESIIVHTPTGDLSLAGQTGDVLQWEKKLNTGSWEIIPGTATTTFSETPVTVGEWSYRALVQSGVCSSDYTDPHIIDVIPAEPDYFTLTAPAGPTYTGSPSGNFVIALFDEYDNPTFCRANTTFNLSTNSSSSSHSFNPASPLVMTINTYSSTFTYTDTKVGTHNITASYVSGSVGLTGESLTVPITILLPEPWLQTNIGASNGTTEFFPEINAGTFKLSAQGLSAPKSDVMNFVYQQLCGTGTVIARLDNVVNGGWAGVMMRESNLPGSKVVLFKTKLYNPNTIVGYRSVTNGNMVNMNQSVPSIHWMKIQRTGNSFKIFTSYNGTSWIRRYTTSVTMNNCINAGFFTENAVSGRTTTSWFDHAEVVGYLKETDEENSGINGEELFEVFVNPNPANDFVMITIPENNETVRLTVINATGLVVETSEINTIDANYFLGHIKPGMYILRFERNGIIINKRLMVL
ncbi:MAG: T9SS type A sorting domain-containing protein [Bacteroidales bacterium]|nr:T9SS type A sorting domain-containing protein [Bacteroidales bacterium]